MLTPKINQDSFKVIKSFPEGTKPFNWLFGVFDGHGPHGEVMSQFAADAMPVVLNTSFKEISLACMPHI
jgi:serine/threonine protein phosphatase PrpC